MSSVKHSSLVITRRENEIIMIGDENGLIGEIEIVEVHSNRTRIALRFPENIIIKRKEVADEWIK